MSGRQQPALDQARTHREADQLARQNPGRRRHKASWIPKVSYAVLLVISVAVVAAPLIAGQDPNVLHPSNLLQGPSLSHWLGTDDLGRDMLSRLLYGGRTDLGVAGLSTVLAVVGGVPAGLLIGMFEGRLSQVVLRACDILLAFPAVLLAMLAATFLGGGLLSLSGAIALVTFPIFVRLARSVMLAQRNMQYVEACRALGCGTPYIVLKSVLPNAAGSLLVQAALSAANAVVLAAGLSFLGLGIQPPTPSWGLALREGQSYLYQDPWFGVFPGLLLVAVVLALNVAADALAAKLRGGSRS